VASVAPAATATGVVEDARASVALIRLTCAVFSSLATGLPPLKAQRCEGRLRGLPSCRAADTRIFAAARASALQAKVLDIISRVRCRWMWSERTSRRFGQVGDESRLSWACIRSNERADRPYNSVSARGA